MGVELVEGRDLVVDRNRVFMRTTNGLQRVDVIYRRIDDDFLDPLAFRPDSLLGVPGLINAYRAGNVALANAVGTGRRRRQGHLPVRARDDPLLPRRGADPAERADLLGANPTTSSCILDQIDELVVKAVDESGGYGMLIGPAATPAGARGVPRPGRGGAARVHRPADDRALAPPDVRRRRAARAATSTCGRSCCAARTACGSSRAG